MPACQKIVPGRVGIVHGSSSIVVLRPDELDWPQVTHPGKDHAIDLRKVPNPSEDRLLLVNHTKYQYDPINNTTYYYYDSGS
ncbi:hypothetical protein AFLA_010770 [Aspergillus flavus NRRL3357]|nr:hypothetical protein AFLA_010770 [Aspergillus flavus NRRL3357]